MNDERRVAELLRDLGRGPVPVESSGMAERRGRLVAAIAGSIRREAPQRRRRGVAVAMALALAMAVLVAGGFGLRTALYRAPPAPSSVAAAKRATLSAGAANALYVHGATTSFVSHGSRAELVAGDELATSEAAGSELVLPSGTQIDVEVLTRVSLAQLETTGERVRLTIGAIFVQVPTLAQGASFSVETPDAVVVVHGTAFRVRVERDASGGARTGVTVRDGRVTVEQGSRRLLLGPGDSWTSSEPAKSAVLERAEPASQPPGNTTEPASPAAMAKNGSRQPTTNSEPSSASATDLARQNELFSLAEATRRRGDDAGALARFDLLLTRYPTSPLAPEARVERFRALKRLGRDGEAAHEARRYLTEHADGPARDEARDVALGSR